MISQADYMLIVLLIPTAFQLIYGSKAIYRHTRLRFKIICLVSVVAHVLCSALVFLLVTAPLRKAHADYAFNSPVKGSVAISVLVFLILLIVMGLQLYLKVAHKNRLD